MSCRIRHIAQYAGLIVAAVVLFNGVTYRRATAADGSKTGATDTSSFQSLLRPEEPDPSIKASIAEDYGKLPLSFEANSGQADEEVRFLSRGNGYTLYLTSGEVVLNLRRASVEKNERQAFEKNPQANELKRIDNEVIRLKNIGANPHPEFTGLEELPGKSNYFIGNDPGKWHANVPNYGKVAVKNVYPGIDLVYYGSRRKLEYDWIVAPGSDPDAVRFAVEGKGDLRVNAQGDLLLDEKGEVRLNKPLIYQERDGDHTEVAGEYVVLDKREVGIKVDKYDPSLPLVIDPILIYSTYIGGSDSEYVYGGTIDASGNAYITGSTLSIDLPVVNAAYGSNTGDYDAFVTKLNTSGDALVYSTYIGGYERDEAYGIVVDTFGNAHIVGATESSNFPTVNQYETNDAYIDAFVAKLNASGGALLYSTYIGGDGQDYGQDIAVDTSGNAYVAGLTSSTDFPTENPLQASNGGGYDAFATKLNTAGNDLVYSTYLGGSDTDYGYAIALDSSSNAYVTGITVSTDFPTENPFQESNGGGTCDAFVTKLNAAGNSIIYSTYLGGADADYGYAIAVDSSDNAYAAGGTYSTDFPTENPFQESNGGGGNCDAFVTKLNTAGSALVYSTYLGGSG